MPKKKQTVWVIMHYEYMGAEPCVRIDSVQFHVSSTYAKLGAASRTEAVSLAARRGLISL